MYLIKKNTKNPEELMLLKPRERSNSDEINEELDDKNSNNCSEKSTVSSDDRRGNF